MLASTQLQGADLFQRVIDAAAARARSTLGGGIALRRCDDVEINQGHGEVHLEAWCVRRNDGAVTISAMATGRDDGGRERMVAAGRFTFSVAAAEHEESVARWPITESWTK